MSVPFSNFLEFLAWVRSPAGLVMMGIAISLMFRDFDWFMKLKGNHKSLVMFSICVVLLPLVFVYLPERIPEEAIQKLEPLFDALILGVIAYLSNQGAHELWNKRVVDKNKLDEIRLADSPSSDLYLKG